MPACPIQRKLILGVDYRYERSWRDGKAIVVVKGVRLYCVHRVRPVRGSTTSPYAWYQCTDAAGNDLFHPTKKLDHFIRWAVSYVERGGKGNTEEAWAREPATSA